MTCIVGLVEDGTVYIGADSQASYGWSRNMRADEKVFRNGEFLFGVCGSPRVSQLLRYAFVAPAIADRQDVYAYLVVDFVNALRKCLQEGGVATKKDENEAMTGSSFLAGFRGGLYRVETDYQIEAARDPFNADGVGRDIALGALFVLQHVKLTPEKKLEQALMAAERYSNGVAGPFHIQFVRQGEKT